MAQVERIFGARIAMNTDKQHIGAVIKNALRAVTVVVVHVKHSHTGCALVAQRLRSHSRVVQKTVPPHEVRPRMVARRARTAERSARTTGHAHCCAGSGIGAGLGSLPGASGQG